jgi:hypothetical protein
VDWGIYCIFDYVFSASISAPPTIGLDACTPKDAKPATNANSNISYKRKVSFNFKGSLRCETNFTYSIVTSPAARIAPVGTPVDDPPAFSSEIASVVLTTLSRRLSGMVILSRFALITKMTIDIGTPPLRMDHNSSEWPCGLAPTWRTKND